MCQYMSEILIVYLFQNEYGTKKNNNEQCLFWDGDCVFWLLHVIMAKEIISIGVRDED